MLIALIIPIIFLIGMIDITCHKPTKKKTRLAAIFEYLLDLGLPAFGFTIILAAITILISILLLPVEYVMIKEQRLLPFDDTSEYRGAFVHATGTVEQELKYDFHYVDDSVVGFGNGTEVIYYSEFDAETLSLLVEPNSIPALVTYQTQYNWAPGTPLLVKLITVPLSSPVEQSYLRLPSRDMIIFELQPLDMK